MDESTITAIEPALALGAGGTLLYGIPAPECRRLTINEFYGLRATLPTYFHN